MAMVPEEKVWNEGTKEQSPSGLGQFTIMKYVEHACDISDAQNTPGRLPEEQSALDPSADKGNLRKLYSQIADVLLQFIYIFFHSLKLDPSPEFEDTWDVARRPLT
ncbi:uncharacterized protein BP5553_01916 [Venustampulla echinocandica]|uniref:Uncharacterized protein n=1 Tax=Venustampulla echinocandica TaxID=2656787 RepID=A0A370U2D6_9HELO|nr:uncharacterized protein BP5553_01916 [Venustampulla echinocandica]RDL41937.1 hypothetical protein BP5553_01916 [Venustampulla echinocandica]